MGNLSDSRRMRDLCDMILPAAGSLCPTQPILQQRHDDQRFITINAGFDLMVHRVVLHPLYDNSYVGIRGTY